MTSDLATMSPAQRLAAVRERIEIACERAGRDAAGITLVAVGKTKPAGEIAALADAGQVDFGENYLQEASGKIAVLEDRGLNWHFIGHIQSNKCADIARQFNWVHGVDRARVARRLDAAASQLGKTLDVFIQVNVDDESAKSGAAADDLPALVAEIASMSALRLRGLMAIPAPASGLAAQRRPFAALRNMLESVRGECETMNCLSMGMSADIEAAILEGATHVRVGTALFGPRHYPEPRDRQDNAT